ncbi:uncharacterized protein N7500_010848 [Penicillium coprophilum]|uniref:uncharacterized protein n=1 Tax=Penicillium coprophilum TaxID=36646 RepID=UPI0023927309|nr:uncharacterized protein N7500_010848 [Penicillium coprophilum]KAJ5150659.1 hypothetical protein N7500_010848 [Penicillium coprophilum]
MLIFSHTPKTDYRNQDSQRTSPSALPILMAEKRALPWLDIPTKEFLERDLRNEKQMQEAPEISFEVTGSTSNIYKTVIAKLPRCTCPDVKFRKSQCKHICFVLSAINAPGKLRYQRAFLPSELREMLSTSSLEDIEERSTLISASQRKPVEGKCPICFNDFKSNHGARSCHSCNNNVHEACFKVWEATVHASQHVFSCLHCNAPWKSNQYRTPHLAREAV